MADDATITTAAQRQTRTAPQTSFTGHVMQDPLPPVGGPTMLGVTNVTFVPGARTRWHTHEDQQVLVVLSGTGMVQVKDRPPQVLHPGDVAVVPPGIVHWHGATVDSLFTHTSLVHGSPDTTTWLEPVDDGEYRPVATMAGR